MGDVYEYLLPVFLPELDQLFGVTSISPSRLCRESMMTTSGDLCFPRNSSNSSKVGTSSQNSIPLLDEFMNPSRESLKSDSTPISREMNNPF